MQRIAIIDGNSLINRAYYAMRTPMITKDGIYTHAIFGFLNMLDKIRRDYEPEYMAVAFDMKAPTFRHKEFDEYKAGRKKMPPELAMQIPLLKDILDAMRIKRIEEEGFEADDLIGTIARSAEEAGLEPFIVTGDKDQLQLATDTTKIIYTKRGVSDFDLFDHDSFVEVYGFTPLQFIDYKGLAGDSSDNIPGVPGVGAKSATKLIQDFGSVEDIIAHVEDIKPAGLQKKIAENTQSAMMSKKLATINVNVPIETDIQDFRIGETDYDALVEIYKRLEFNRFLSRLKKVQPAGAGAEDGQLSFGELVGGAAGAAGDADTAGATNGFGTDEAADIGGASDGMNVPTITEEIRIESDDELKNLKLNGDVVIRVFGDKNHLAPPQVYGAALLNEDKYYYVDVVKAPGFFEWLDEQEIRFIGHDLIDDYYMLLCHGVTKLPTAFDTAIAQYVIDSSRSNYKLEALANEYLHESLEISEQSGAAICRAIAAIYRQQAEQIQQEGLEEVLYKVELPLIEPMAGMEKEGFKTDRAYLEEYGKVLSGKIEELAAVIQMLAGEEFNINSPIQLGEILFEKLELPHGKKTKRGYSTSADVLEKIRDAHPIVPNIMEYRTLSKLKSTYIDGLIPLISETDGKIRAHFQQTVTATGRISCTEPNLQNIPIRQELGRKLRKAFVPEKEECVLVGADYSQIELRVLAHMSGDEALIQAFNNGEDIHRATAANVLGIPEDQITVEERSRAKAVNFGVIYGMSAFGLSSNLHITRKDANDYIEAYFAKHQQVKKFMDGEVEFCKANGYVTTLMGRKRYIKEIHTSQYMVRQIGERLAMNTPIQGSAADIIKIAMIKVYNALKEQGLKSKLILQIHDELIINTYPDEKETVKQLLVENMESAYEMAVELKAELNESANWYELK
ncbi:MAG: DNA polymerase I [Firmicutes bacterium]|nr:DNA polymerase I [Bacillota bacterium]